MNLCFLFSWFVFVDVFIWGLAEPKGQKSAFAPTSWHSGFGVCVVLSFSMLVVFLLNPWLV